MNNIRNFPIKTDDLSKNYGRSIGISDVNIYVEKGEIYGFLGPNGAGKTTTIRLILGLMKPTKGKIRMFDKEIGRKNRKELLKLVGYLPGELGLYTDLTGTQYLNFILSLRKKYLPDLTDVKLNKLKEIFSINFDKQIKTYSKGMKQIIGIIQAFAHNPELVILDEPTSGLDPLMQEKFYEYLINERKEGNTILFSSHNLAEVQKICDRVSILKKGNLFLVERVEKIFSSIGKRITLSLKDDSVSSLTEEINKIGVEKIDKEGDRYIFYYKGEMDMLINYLNKLSIKDFTCEFPMLEDVFLKYYGE
jgi:ABC-2 type transport system ATP-binding protein